MSEYYVIVDGKKINLRSVKKIYEDSPCYSSKTGYSILETAKGVLIWQEWCYGNGTDPTYEVVSKEEAFSRAQKHCSARSAALIMEKLGLDVEEI